MRKGAVARWLVGSETRLPRRIRLIFIAFVLAALALAYSLTGSEDLQLLLLGLFLFGLFPAIERKLGEPDDYTRAVAQERTTPSRILALSLLLGAPWAAVVLYAESELELGTFFWLMVLVWPWLELLMLLAERDLRRNGVDSWLKQRPLRDSLFVGAATVVLITAITLLQGFALAEAVVTGALCGLAMLAMSGGCWWLVKRSYHARGIALK